jgi:sulfatase modifying factor 1
MWRISGRVLCLACTALVACCSDPKTKAVDAGDPTDASTDTSVTIPCPEVPPPANCADSWCRIEPGTFVLGSPETEPCRGLNTEQQAQVTLTHPFLIQQHEVTQAEWEAAGFPNPSRSVGPDKPIDFVNWFEAMAYANALSDKAGLPQCYELISCTGTIGSGCDGPDDFCCTPTATPDIFTCTGEMHTYPNWYECPGYRLPTGPEWEYAARAGTTNATYNGDVTTDSSSCQVDNVVEPIAWYCANTDSSVYVREVCGKEPNAWGLYDILGNVMEWTDWYYNGHSLEFNQGTAGPFTDPLGVTNPDCEFATLRGGGVVMESCLIRAANMFGDLSDTRCPTQGFRIARTIFE